jgi:D-apiose dehydrogenase
MSRHIKIALVGAGYFARFQLEGWRDAGQPVQALCDLDGARAAQLGQTLGIARTYTDLAQMLEAESPDLVDIVVPPAAQAEVVRTVLKHGIPAICQKPFGRNLGESQALSALAAQAGVPLVIHENFRFTPWFREARRLIDAGRLGELYSVSFRMRTGDGQGPRAYLDRQPYFQTMPQLLIRETGVHFVDCFRYLMGEVVAVSAHLRKLNPVIAGEDAGLVIFEFAQQRAGLFDGNRLSDHVSDNPRHTFGEMWLEGSAGVLRLDGAGRLWWKPHQQPETEHLYANQQPGAFGGAVTALQAHVLAHLQRGTALENQAHEYLSNLRIQQAIYHAHDTGRRVDLASFSPDPAQ